MFFTTHLVPSSMKLIYFIVVYAFYVLGYTFASISKWSGLAIITNDPKQRPVLGGIEAAYTTVFLSLFSMYNSLYLVPKYGGFNNPDFFHELVLTVVGAAGILYALCVAAIWSKDRMETITAATGSAQKVRLKDMWQVLKGNRALQIFVLSVTSDKLAMQTHSNQVVIVMLYGIIIGNFAMSGQMAMPAIIVNLLMIFFGIKWARTMFLYIGTVLIAWTITIVAMKFYPLTKEKMIEIQAELTARREKNAELHADPVINTADPKPAPLK